MREMLRNPCFVREQPTRDEDTGDLAERLTGPLTAAAHVIAGAEIDDEVEPPVCEWQAANVAFDGQGLDAVGADAIPRDSNEARVEIDADQVLRGEAPGEHRQCDAAAAPHLEDPQARWDLERADHRWNLD